MGLHCANGLVYGICAVAHFRVNIGREGRENNRSVYTSLYRVWRSTYGSANCM